MRRFPLFLFAVFCCLMPGCRQSAPAKDYPQKTFTLRGKIVSTDATHVVVDHEAIPGFMDAMTMPYKVKDPSILPELHPGDRITARLTVSEDSAGFRDPLLDNIVVIAQARPDYKPAVQYNIPKAGDAVPDFALRNQSDRTIHLAQFKGKVLLVTFIYTRCPFADFCPRMSHNFAEVDKLLASDPAVFAKTHLLSISFDPAYDTPAVLRSYGGAYTGQYTRETFAHWDFAAPTPKELPAIEQYFNVGVTGTDPKTLSHSLSTVLIGKDGRIAAWYPSNEWKPADVVTDIRSAVAA